jgi:hypothetical protein
LMPFLVKKIQRKAFLLPSWYEFCWVSFKSNWARRKAMAKSNAIENQNWIKSLRKLF